MEIAEIQRKILSRFHVLKWLVSGHEHEFSFENSVSSTAFVPNKEMLTETDVPPEFVFSITENMTDIV